MAEYPACSAIDNFETITFPTINEMTAKVPDDKMKIQIYM